VTRAGRRARIGVSADKRTEEATIFESISSSPLDDRYESGSIPGEGTFFCMICGSQLAMQETDELPDCSQCGGSEFRRDSIFEAHQDHSATTSEFSVPTLPSPPGWLDRARELLTGEGPSLAFLGNDGEVRTFPIEQGWTRIGRSLTADLRLDDPSVSRRHALIVAEPGKPLRVLDDRSLNGLTVNGETVEWARLKDGDELSIGRYSLHVLQP